MTNDSIDHFRKMFAFNAWANREVLSNLEALSGVVPADALRLISHIIGAEALWLARIKQQPSGPVWPVFDLQACLQKSAEMDSLWNRYLAAVTPSGLDGVVVYVNSKGEKYSSRAQDILIHVLFHSHYHRGQIARAVRAAGHVPAYTYYIHAVRQDLVE